jgi:endonuclease-3
MGDAQPATNLPFDEETLERRQALYAEVAPLLQERYGYPEWRQHLPPVDELVCTILSQNTSDTNRDKGFEALKAALPDWESVRDAPEDMVRDLIRPAGLANQKAPRIQRALRQITEERGEISLDFLQSMSVEEARDWLTSIKGVGLKTAAIILLFAYHMPAFPVDTHVHRLSKRIGFIDEKTTANKAHAIMEAIVPPDDYYAFHLNLIQHGREVCSARKPKCEACPLTNHCRYFQEVVRQD